MVDLIFATSLDLLAMEIHLQVYDVTQFLEEHPGGDEVILSATGNPPTAHF